MKEYKYAVFIGRFQPLHNVHLQTIKNSLDIAEQLILVIGSSNAAPSIKNPFSFEQRKKFVESCLNPLELSRVKFIEMNDYYYNDNTWVANIQSKTSEYIEDSDPVVLIGNYKDSSSYYLKYFPQWDFLPIKTTTQLSATDVRENLFDVTQPIKLLETCPEPVANWIVNNYIEPITIWTDKSTGYREMVKEFEFIKKYKQQWTNSPFPPTFVCVDAIVICSGHVLVIKRKFEPGKSLYALPGGFIKQNETLKNAMLRELKEETGIKVDKLILENNIIDSKVFDHPDRSLRGRTLTHAYMIKLKDGKLPEIKANDDAVFVTWMPIIDVFKNEKMFYEDHSHIINYFINRGEQ